MTLMNAFADWLSDWPYNGFVQMYGTLHASACKNAYIGESGSAHSRVRLTTVSKDPTGVRNWCTVEIYISAEMYTNVPCSIIYYVQQ